MIIKEYQITAAEGLHARPATKLVKLAKSFQSVISLKKGDKIIKLNSMLNVLSMGLKGADVVMIIIEGEDEAEAAVLINEFFTVELDNL